MTLDDVKDLLATVDPDAKHYFSGFNGDAFTVWEETHRLQFKADNRVAEHGWAFEIYRYTMSEEDPIRDQLIALLDSREDIAYSLETRWIMGTDYVVYTFFCECV